MRVLVDIWEYRPYYMEEKNQNSRDPALWRLIIVCQCCHAGENLEQRKWRMDDEESNLVVNSVHIIKKCHHLQQQSLPPLISGIVI